MNLKKFYSYTVNVIFDLRHNSYSLGSYVSLWCVFVAYSTQVSSVCLCAFEFLEKRCRTPIFRSI